MSDMSEIESSEPSSPPIPIQEISEMSLDEIVNVLDELPPSLELQSDNQYMPSRTLQRSLSQEDFSPASPPPSPRRPTPSPTMEQLLMGISLKTIARIPCYSSSLLPPREPTIPPEHLRRVKSMMDVSQEKRRCLSLPAMAIPYVSPIHSPRRPTPSPTLDELISQRSLEGIASISETQPTLSSLPTTSVMITSDSLRRPTPSPTLDMLRRGRLLETFAKVHPKQSYVTPDSPDYLQRVPTPSPTLEHLRSGGSLEKVIIIPNEKPFFFSSIEDEQWVSENLEPSSSPINPPRRPTPSPVLECLKNGVNLDKFIAFPTEKMFSGSATMDDDMTFPESWVASFSNVDREKTPPIPEVEQPTPPPSPRRPTPSPTLEYLRSGGFLTKVFKIAGHQSLPMKPSTVYKPYFCDDSSIFSPRSPTVSLTDEVFYMRRLQEALDRHSIAKSPPDVSTVPTVDDAPPSVRTVSNDDDPDDDDLGEDDSIAPVREDRIALSPEVRDTLTPLRDPLQPFDRQFGPRFGGPAPAAPGQISIGDERSELRDARTESTSDPNPLFGAANIFKRRSRR